MSITLMNNPPHPRKSNAGMALVIALIFLLVLTLLGVASLSSNSAQERMTYATTDYSRAFQAADSAVSQGERYISSQVASAPLRCATPSPGCYILTTVHSDSSFLGSGSASFWSTNGMSFGTTYNPDGSVSTRTNNGLTRLSNTPQYIVEYIGQDDSSVASGKPNSAPMACYYRVTGQSTGAGTNSQLTATTQSNFVWYFQNC